MANKARTLPPLPQCPKNRNRICKCWDLWASPYDVENIRDHYDKIRSNHNRLVANQLLMSMMVPVPGQPGRKSTQWQYKVPSPHDPEPFQPPWCRILYPCRTQFMHLFGLTESRMQRLMGKKYYSHGYSGERPFRWGDAAGTDVFHALSQTYPGREI